MGAISGLIGTAGGAGGSGFSAPSAAPIQQGVTAGDVVQSQAGVNTSLASQNALLAALQSQNGLQAQNSGLANQQTLSNQLAANNGAGLANQANQQTASLGQKLAANNGAANQNTVYNQGQNLNARLAAVNGVGAQSTALNSQGQLANQLSNAGGVGAQTNALAQQQALNNAVSGGVGAQNAAISGLQGIAGQQQSTAQQYQNIANGTGPNPAQAALNQSTGQNVANQAALMAGQRGAGANVGLIARQAGQQGAATQQQAVGQAATMQANQQLAGLAGLSGAQQAQVATQQAIGGLGSTQAGMQQSGIGQQAQIGAGLTGAQQAAVNAQAQQANAQIGSQQAQQQLLAGQAQNQIAAQQANNAQFANQAQNQIAAQQNSANAASSQANQIAGQQIGATTSAAQGQLQNASQQQQALANYNSAITSGQSNVNTANAGLAQTNMQGQQGIIGGLGNAAGVATNLLPAAAAAARGGLVEKFAEGGVASYQPMPQTSFGQFLQGWGRGNEAVNSPQQSEIAAAPGPNKKFNEGMAKLGTAGGKKLASAFSSSGSSGDNVAGPDGSARGDTPVTAAQGGLARSGGHVRAKNAGEKAVKKGNSYSNDKIPAMLSEGEIVLPRAVTQSKDPVRAAGDFVNKVLAKRKVRA